MKIKPTVSVIIPTFNRGETIEHAIQSVCRQTYAPMEIIVIDDGSFDDTSKKILEMEDDRIIYHALPENKGVSYARNVGVSMAKGEWIAFQDSDDLWREDKLEKQVEYAMKHPGYHLIYSSYLMHRLNGDEVIVPNEGFYGEREGNLFETILVNNVVGAPTMFMKKTSFEHLGGFRTELRCLEDWDLVLRYARNEPIGYVEEALVDAYQTAGGVSSQPAAFYQCRCQMIAENREELLQRNLFDLVVGNLFKNAQFAGVLPIVQQMLSLMLTQK